MMNPLESLMEIWQASQQAKTIWARLKSRLVLQPLVSSRLGQDKPSQAQDLMY